MNTGLKGLLCSLALLMTPYTLSEHKVGAAPQPSSAPLTRGEVRRLSRALSRLERGVRALERKPQRAPQLKRLERALREVKALSARYYQHSTPTAKREAALEARALLLSSRVRSYSRRLSGCESV